MADRYDVIVVGSGFGGAVTACRLAEAGDSVLVLERGRRWDPATFPRRPEDPWLWDQARPENCSGWFDLRIFPKMIVAQGAGVGGGSLVYANVSIDAKPDCFEAGWPPEVTFRALAPHYARVKEMLQARTVPEGQWPERTRLMKLAAERAGVAERFERLDLAVSFDDDWRYALPDPHDARHSRQFVNAHGKVQGTCVHLGNCDIGCDVNARNTLDLNYLARAEAKGAEVRPLHVVRRVAPSADGYEVAFDRLEPGARIPGTARARRVILAAGSLGSTELLLRCRDQYRTLPSLSPFLGRNWSSNGDFLTPALHPGRDVSPTRGPTITSAIDFLEEPLAGQHFYIEDGGFPDLAANYVEALVREGSAQPLVQWLLVTARLLFSGAATNRVMPWFAQGRDAGNGLLSLRDDRLFLDWDIEESAPTIDAIVAMHEKLARLTGGMPIVPLTWRLGRCLITPHPLGGCNMGISPSNGVVDHRGEVFGHPGLYVADGAIVPEAIGLNPSKTIAALAERIAAILVEERAAA